MEKAEGETEAQADAGETAALTLEQLQILELLRRYRNRDHIK